MYVCMRVCVCARAHVCVCERERESLHSSILSSVLKYKRRICLENSRFETIWIEVKLKSYDILIHFLYQNEFVSSQSIFITGMQSSVKEALNYTHMLF